VVVSAVVANSTRPAVDAVAPVIDFLLALPALSTTTTSSTDGVLAKSFRLTPWLKSTLVSKTVLLYFSLPIHLTMLIYKIKN